MEKHWLFMALISSIVVMYICFLIVSICMIYKELKLRYIRRRTRNEKK